MTIKDIADDVVSYVEDSLTEYAKKNGYSAVVMSNHVYNTSKQYTSKKDTIDEMKLQKANNCEFNFYSEAFPVKSFSEKEDSRNTEDKNPVTKGDFYVIYNSESNPAVLR